MREKALCPVCRKPILQGKETMVKSITLENIIKSKYGSVYEEKLKLNKLMYDEDNSSSQRNNIPSITLENVYIWPKIKKKIRVDDTQYSSTINSASINDRLIIIIPKFNLTEEDISCLCEILNINRATNYIEMELLGIKRFKVNRISNISESRTPLYLASGELIKDIIIDSENLKIEILNKLRIIESIHTEMLQHASYSVSKTLETLYGKKPILPDDNSIQNLEFISFYYLNVIKSNEKKKFYLSNNVIERIDWYNLFI